MYLKINTYFRTMNSWLKEEVCEYPCQQRVEKYHPSMYYTTKEEEKVKHNLIKSNTRHHDINCLFVHLVDYCIDNHLVDNNNLPIINSSFKRPFIKFVYDTSKK